MDTTWLVAYDFSRLAHAAVVTAAEMLTREGGGRLMVVHVHQLGAGVDRGALADLANEALEHAYIADAARQLDEDLADIVAPGVTIERRVVAGRAASVVCGIAAAEKASLIVVGGDGQLPFDSSFKGSFAEAILRQGHCAVLVVKSPLDEIA